ncbi:MAG: hypothetical protein ACR2OJ_11740 [Hyphomicrobiales bacterium]
MNKIVTTVMATTISIFLLLQSPQTSFAADVPPPKEDYYVPPEAELSFNFVPLYVWLPGFSGETAVFGNTAKIDVTPLDIVKNLGDFLDVLDGLYIGGGHVRLDDFGFMYDVTYLSIASSQSIEGKAVKGALDVGFDVTVGSLLGTYKIFDDAATTVDLVAGARIWGVKLDLTLNLGPLGTAADDGATWVDPVVGFKAQHFVTEHTFLTGWGMIGGFGAGSDFMYDVFGGVGYEINDRFNAVGGIRATYADYKNSSGFKWDMTMYGPVLGAAIKF